MKSATVKPSIVLFAVAACLTAAADKTTPVRIIFDTDMMGDVDDVGTVAVLHALADQGEAEIPWDSRERTPGAPCASTH